jgi:uncharacterized protein DUF1353
MKRYGRSIAIISCLIALAVYAMLYLFPNPETGKFHGELNIRKVDNAEDNHTFELITDYSFTDSKGREWTAPEGVKVNGASIPMPLWSILGGPWSGEYTRASVIHDHFCDTETRTWLDVHRVFYEAMISEGVPESKAKLMYYGVYRFGPRWTLTARKFNACMMKYCLSANQNSPDRIALKDGFCGSCDGPASYEGRVAFTPRFDIETYDDFAEKLDAENYSIEQIEAIAARQVIDDKDALQDDLPDEFKEAMLELGLIE